MAMASWSTPWAKMLGLKLPVYPAKGYSATLAVSDPMLAKGGSGLGLALVRALLLKHGGTLKIESEEGIGTEVRCTFPMSADKRAVA